MARTRGGAKAQNDYIVVKDMDGTEVKIPFLQLAAVDKRIPQKNADGVETEYVNMTGKTQQMSQGHPYGDKTLVVPPYGVLRGVQWAEYAEPSRAWGDVPMFMEREYDKDGKFDPVYLLTPEQVALECKRIKSWRWGPRRLDLLRKNGKKQEYDKIGRPKIDEGDLVEDRPEVIKAIDNRIRKLEEIAKVERKAEIGV